jgi:hypothetical protein
MSENILIYTCQKCQWDLELEKEFPDDIWLYKCECWARYVTTIMTAQINKKNIW